VPGWGWEEARAEKVRVLIAAADPVLRAGLLKALRRTGLRSRAVARAPEALAALAASRTRGRADATGAVTGAAYDALVLDLDAVPAAGTSAGRLGGHLCRAVRARHPALPLLILGASNDPWVKVAVLEAGADDCVAKPFHPDELIARLGAILRRARPGIPEEPGAGGYAPSSPSSPRVMAVMTAGDLRIDLERGAVSRRGEPVALTRIEFGLLRELVTHPDRVLTYEQLYRSVWGEPSCGDVRPVHVHVSHLRRKIEPKIEPPGTPRRIVCVPGVGYRFRLRDEL
jgi:two-component system response regulator MprA